MLLFTLTACVLSGVLFGPAPAWQAARTDANASLKETARAVGNGRHRLRHMLVVAEFALALTLLTGGGLTIQASSTLPAPISGSGPRACSRFYLPVEDDRLEDADAVDAFYRQFAERVSAVPSVTSVSYSSGLPVRGAGSGIPFAIVGRPVSDPFAASQRPLQPW